MQHSSLHLLIRFRRMTSHLQSQEVSAFFSSPLSPHCLLSVANNWLEDLFNMCSALR